MDRMKWFSMKTTPNWFKSVSWCSVSTRYDFLRLVDGRASAHTLRRLTVTKDTTADAAKSAADTT